MERKILWIVRLRYFNSGGAPMPTELIQQVKDLGIFFGEGYGMTESTALGISNPIMGLSKTGSIGIPYIDMDVRLVDLESGTEEVKPGEPGEIIMKSPFIMKGYWTIRRRRQANFRTDGSAPATSPRRTKTVITISWTGKRT
jgi:acyl-CoA synthetase (AMP-forming)/AMP-acid ligase II